MLLSALYKFKNNKPSKKRVGRGIGCTLGKTCGRGHKGYKSRSGSKRRIGFEGGQMPLHRRLPKFGFSSRKMLITEEIYLSDLQIAVARDKIMKINLASLKKAGLISNRIRFVKVFKDRLSVNKESKGVSIDGSNIRLSKSCKDIFTA
jgi:large subunit ribosomal protein L15